jgi:mitochondrial distribution and morphology protein 10
MNTLQTLFLQATAFPSNNTYNSLNVTPSSLLSFPTPTGLIVTLSSLATPNFATSYVLHSTGNLRGSISYLYTTPSLKIAPSETNELRSCFEGYQIPSPLRSVGTRKDWEVWEKGERIDTRDVLLYGMMKIPDGVINGLYLRRMSPARLLKIMAVSEAGMRTDPVDGNGAGTAKKPKGNVLASIVTDRGKYSYEGLYSTAGGLVGLRGLWNFGWDPNVEEVENQTGRLSIGGEVYYGIFNKSGGGTLYALKGRCRH